MAAITLRQRERHGAMANTAMLTIQYFCHADCVTVQNRSKQRLMTHFAGHPLVMHLVGEQHVGLVQCILHDDIRIVLTPLSLAVQAGTRCDLFLPDCFDPVNLVARCIRREHRQRLFRILQDCDGRI